MLTINVSPGLLSAIFLLTLDFIAPLALDIIMSNATARTAFRHVRRGNAVTLRDASVPALTSGVLGYRLSWQNLAWSLLKLGVLAVVFEVNIGIDGTVVNEFAPVQLSSTFSTIFSDAAFARPVVYTVERRIKSSANCRRIDGDEIEFYKIRFNLEGNVIIPSDLGEPNVNFSGQYEPDDKSIVCMDGENADKREPLARVLGCFRPDGLSCDAEKLIALPADTVTLTDVATYRGFQGTDHNVTVIENVDYDALAPNIGGLRNLTCLSQFASRKIGEEKLFRVCLVVARDMEKNITLVHRWHYEENTQPEITEVSARYVLATREAGAVFAGDLDVERAMSADLLNFGRRSSQDHFELAGLLVARASEYVADRVTENINTGSKVIAQIDVWRIVLGYTMTAVVVAIALLMSVIGRAPLRLNTVDGLSSMLREERESTQVSGRTGPPAVVGVTISDRLGEGELSAHLGPLRSNEQPVDPRNLSLT